MEVSEFQKILLVLGALKNTISNDLIVTKRYLHDEDLKWSMYQKLTIGICSFKDEISKIGRYKKEVKQLEHSLEIIRPALKRINKWTDLEKLRNTAFAHPMRDRKSGNNPTSVNDVFHQARVPKSYCETLVLAELSVYAIAVLLCQYHEEHEYAKAQIETVYMKDPDESEADSINSFNEAIESFREHAFKMEPSLEQCFGEYRPLTGTGLSHGH